MIRNAKFTGETHFQATTLELRSTIEGSAEALPKGVCGRMTGIALTYNVADDYGTVFLPGCLAKTRAEKVSAGKVKLFADHGPFTDTHVGVVRSLTDVGDSVVMSADLFDTEAGRAMKEYLAAVIDSGADTGLSIGFRPRDKEWRASPDGTGDSLLYYKEIELRETSITPVPAVPGTDVTSVRHEEGETDAALTKRTLTLLLKALPEAEARQVFDETYPAAPIEVAFDEDDSLERAEDAEAGKKKYGDVAFADEKNKKYPIDTKEHAKAAWAYINKEKNAAFYTSGKAGVSLATVKDKIKAACKKFGVEISDDENKSDVASQDERIRIYRESFAVA